MSAPTGAKIPPVIMLVIVIVRMSSRIIKRLRGTPPRSRFIIREDILTITITSIITGGILAPVGADMACTGQAPSATPATLREPHAAVLADTAMARDRKRRHQNATHSRQSSSQLASGRRVAGISIPLAGREALLGRIGLLPVHGRRVE